MILLGLETLQVCRTKKQRTVPELKTQTSRINYVFINLWSVQDHGNLNSHNILFDFIIYIITECDAKGFYSVPMVLSHTHTHTYTQTQLSELHTYIQRERECESEK